MSVLSRLLSRGDADEHLVIEPLRRRHLADVIYVVALELQQRRREVQDLQVHVLHREIGRSLVAELVDRRAAVVADVRVGVHEVNESAPAARLAVSPNQQSGLP